MRETIQELLKRKLDDAKIMVQNAYLAKERAIAKADADIAAAIAKRDTLDNLQDLDWPLYARTTLGIKNER